MKQHTLLVPMSTMPTVPRGRAASFFMSPCPAAGLFWPSASASRSRCGRRGGRAGADRPPGSRAREYRRCVRAAAADAHGGGDMGGEIGLGRDYVDERCAVCGGVGADEHDQVAEAVEAVGRDHHAVAVDQHELALALPEGEGLALDETNVERVGEAPLHRGRAYPRHRLEPPLRLRRIDSEERRAARHGDGAQHGLAAGAPAALYLHIADGEPATGRPGKDALFDGGDAPRDHAGGLQREADGGKGGKRGDGRAEEDGAARPGPRLALARSGRVVAAPQESHAAFSTIQRTSAAKSMPACLAMSGTREVGVMPGWVLTSSSTKRPGSPLVSP